MGARTSGSPDEPMGINRRVPAMNDGSPHLAGEIADWPSRHAMATTLRAAGLRVAEGRYSLRVQDCEHFAFQEYGGDLGVPRIEADAESVERLILDAKLVSDALARATIRHRFEIYDHAGRLVEYRHFEWPRVNWG